MASPPLPPPASPPKPTSRPPRPHERHMENNGDAGLILRTAEHLILNNASNCCRLPRLRKPGRSPPVGSSGPGPSSSPPKPHQRRCPVPATRRYPAGPRAFASLRKSSLSTDSAGYDVMAGSRLNFVENRLSLSSPTAGRRRHNGQKPLDPALAGGWFLMSKTIPSSFPGLLHPSRAAAKAGFDMGVPSINSTAPSTRLRAPPLGDELVSVNLRPLMGAVVLAKQPYRCSAQPNRVVIFNHDPPRTHLRRPPRTPRHRRSKNHRSVRLATTQLSNSSPAAPPSTVTVRSSNLLA